MPHSRLSAPIGRPAARLVGLLQAGVIVLAGWFVFSPALGGAWLWDDRNEIVLNPEITGAGQLEKIWFAPASADYFPLKSTVQWAQWRLWGDQVAGYHWTTLGLHLLSALLLWRLLRKLGLRCAWLGGLLFAIHPLVVESVAWIAELKNTLSLPPLLLAMGAYADYVERGRRKDYLLALLLFLAAMLCKTSVVMFPAAILIFSWWKRGRIGRDDLKASAPFFAVSLALGVVTVWFQSHRAIINWVIPMGGLASRVAGAGLAIAFYVSKSVLPIRLVPLYPRWTIDPPTALQFIPWLVIAGLLGWCWTRRATWGRHALFGLGWFLVNLLPVLGFIPISYMNYTWVADHFAYLPVIGLIGLAVAGADALVAWLAVPARPYAVALGVALLALLAGASRRYAANFSSREALWSYTLRHNPRAWLAHNNLGCVYATTDRLAEAIAQFEAALRFKPDYAAAELNLGNALLQTGRGSEAIGHYEAALRLDPKIPHARHNLEVIRLRSRQDWGF